MATSNPYVSVVIPVYNSAAGLPELTRQLREQLESLGQPWEVLLVDDGSPDDSASAIDAVCSGQPNFRGLLLSRNHGQHYATVCGLKHARGEFVVTMDDDLQNPPQDIPKLIQAIQEGAHIAIGAIEVKKQGWFRRFSSGVMDSMLNLLLNKPRGLKLSSFRCLSRKATALIAQYEGIYPYMPALMFNAIPLRKITNVTVAHYQRTIGKSTYSFKGLLRLASYLFINHSKFLLRGVVLAGVVLAALAILMALYFTLRYFIYQSSPLGWTSLAVLVTFFSGMILVSLGIIGEYIGRIIDQSDRMPRYQIYRTIN